jgi:hypothetical protein
MRPLRLVHRVAARLRALVADRGLLYSATGLAAANWLLDAASLWVFVLAYGSRVDVDALLVSYGLANVLAAIPLTPGGLGVVEAVLTSSLVGFGTPRGAAILGVISWRLVNFWLPIPAGGLAYLSLRAGAGVPTRKRRKEPTRLAADSALAADRPKVWLERHGFKVPGAAEGVPSRTSDESPGASGIEPPASGPDDFEVSVVVSRRSRSRGTRVSR